MNSMVGAIIGAVWATPSSLSAIWCAIVSITLSWIAKMLVKHPLAANLAFGLIVTLISLAFTFALSLILGIPLIN